MPMSARGGSPPGPMCGPTTPGADDFVQLAAARHPAELEAWWRHLDGGRDVPAVPWPEPAALAALAAALAADVLAWLSGRPLPHEGVQLAFDPVRWDWTRHPVLPVPRNLMQEPAA